MRRRRRLPGSPLLAALLACAGCAALPGRPPPAGPEPAGTGAWTDARGLLERPDFVRTGAGEATFSARAVSFCGHVHKRVVTWSLAPLDDAGRQRGRPILERALAKYPLEFLAPRLDSVCLVPPQSLKQRRDEKWDPPAAGTYGERSVYLSLQPAARRQGGARFTEAVFHHELSSLLVGRHPEDFDAPAWRAANPPGFEYTRPAHASPLASPRFLADGFVCSYGQSDLENDINTYAMWLFTRADWLFAQAEIHPRVRRKLEILLAFYERQHPAFTRDFFLRHCRTALDDEDQAQVDALTLAIAANPADPAPYARRACLFNNLELFPDAIQDADAALRFNPQHGYALYVRGWALVRLGHYAEAADDFTRSIACDPAWLPAYRERAFAYERLGRTAEARKDRREAQARQADGTGHDPDAPDLGD